MNRTDISIRISYLCNTGFWDRQELFSEKIRMG
jgi:hypothetical protein